jgi:hypothetical protein
VKLIVEDGSRRLLGGQVIGSPMSVTNALDVLSTACYAKLKADELAHLDLCYAPSIASSTRHPIVVAGLIYIDVLHGEKLIS